LEPFVIVEVDAAVDAIKELPEVGEVALVNIFLLLVMGLHSHQG
jgi:hypothetical protein